MINFHTTICIICGSAFGGAPGCLQERFGFLIPVEAKYLLFYKTVYTRSVVQLVSCLSVLRFFPAVERPGREAGHSHASVAFIVWTGRNLLLNHPHCQTMPHTPYLFRVSTRGLTAAGYTQIGSVACNDMYIYINILR